MIVPGIIDLRNQLHFSMIVRRKIFNPWQGSSLISSHPWLIPFPGYR
jgi:hypothetical protein